MMRSLIPLMVLLGVALTPLGRAQTIRSVPGLHWRSFNDDPNQIALYEGGLQLGNLDLESGDYYRHLASGGFETEPSKPPLSPPAGMIRKKCACSKGCACLAKKCGCKDGKHCNPDCKCARVIGGAGYVEPSGKPNYGVEEKKFPERPEHVVNGVAVSKEQLLEAIAGKPELPNDANQLCVTAIGPPELGVQLLRDFATAPSLVPWKGKVKVKAYEPSHWAVADVGYVSPAIYCQAPDGTVLYRWESYPGAEELAQVLRVKSPDYRPDRDPGPNQPALAGDGMLAWLLSALGGLLCFGSFLGLVLLLGLLALARAQPRPQGE